MTPCVQFTEIGSPPCGRVVGRFLRQHHQIAVGILDVGDALAPRLLGGFDDHTHACLPRASDGFIDIVDIDAQLDTVSAGGTLGLTVQRGARPELAEPDFGRARRQRDENRLVSFGKAVPRAEPKKISVPRNRPCPTDRKDQERGAC
jgi:hypothetical protein